MSPAVSRFRATTWFALFAITRAAAACIAPLLQLLQHYSLDDQVLGLLGLAYGAASILVLARRPWLQGWPVAWAVDALAVLGLVLASGEWRSPFYLLALTALILPATGLGPRLALGFGFAFAAGYFAVALVVGVDWQAVASTARFEAFTTHLLVPLLVTTALAYAAALMRTLERERERSERLALEAERQRIAWDLHDSAKQRIHATHLVLSALRDDPRRGDRNGEGAIEDASLGLALRELDAAAADMDTSLRDLREPLVDGSSLGSALREWADRLAAPGGVAIDVVGDAPTLPSFVAAHAYRIGREALTNAARHASADHVEVVLRVRDGRLHLVVADDGRGMPRRGRAGANGLRSMRSRARALGGELSITSGEEDRGTVVALHAPLAAREAAG